MLTYQSRLLKVLIKELSLYVSEKGKVEGQRTLEHKIQEHILKDLHDMLLLLGVANYKKNVKGTLGLGSPINLECGWNLAHRFSYPPKEDPENSPDIQWQVDMQVNIVAALPSIKIELYSMHEPSLFIIIRQEDIYSELTCRERVKGFGSQKREHLYITDPNIVHGAALAYMKWLIKRGIITWPPKAIANLE